MKMILVSESICYCGHTMPRIITCFTVPTFIIFDARKRKSNSQREKKKLDSVSVLHEKQKLIVLDLSTPSEKAEERRGRKREKIRSLDCA